MNTPYRLFMRHTARQRVLRKMALMRAAKERKRLEHQVEREPKLVRWHRFEFGIRDRLTGETHFTELRSVRQAKTALGLILKYCQ